MNEPSGNEKKKNFGQISLGMWTIRSQKLNAIDFALLRKDLIPINIKNNKEKLKQ